MVELIKILQTINVSTPQKISIFYIKNREIKLKLTKLIVVQLSYKIK